MSEPRARGATGRRSAAAPGERRARTWEATPALWRALALGSLAAGTGLALDRPDVAVAGTGLLLSLAVATASRPRDVPVSVRGTAPQVVTAGSVLEVDVSVDAPGVQAVGVRLRGADRVHGETLLLHPGDGPRRVRRRVRVTGWGEMPAARPDWVAVSADGLLVHGPRQAREIRSLVAPTPVPDGSLDPPARVSGRPGPRPARRPGDGSEVLGVREYRAGDLLRRIDWRVSNRRLAATHPALRRAALHVRTTAADSDADVVVLVDTRLDLAPDMGAWDLDLMGRGRAGRSGTDRSRQVGRRPGGGPWDRLLALVRPVLLRVRGLLRPRAHGEVLARPPAASPGGSLDIAVHASLAVCADHLRRGDRVQVVDLGRPRTGGVPAGGGRRHLDRIRYRLAGLSVDKLGLWRTGSLLAQLPTALAGVPASAPAVVLSAFHDDEVAQAVAWLARTGRPTLAYDTAPSSIRPDPRVPRSADALAVAELERRARLRRLAAAGVTVRRW